MARFGRSRPRAVVPLSEHAVVTGRRDTQVGALGRALSAVERFGLVIPETWVVVADVFRYVVGSVLPPGHDPASLVRTILRPAGMERAARARERLLSASLTEELEREIDEAYRTLSDAAPWGLAVRASAILPDQGMARAAGLSSTELAVRSREDLGDAIRRVWALAASERTLVYLKAKRVRELALAVVLQPVVVAESSAVLVTDARAMLGSEGGSSQAVRVIVARAGLGCSASDPAIPEVVHLDSSGAIGYRRPPAKAARLRVHRGVLEWAAPKDEPRGLSDVHLAELAETARRLDTLGPSIARCAIPEGGDTLVVDVEPLHHLGLPAPGTSGTLWGRAAVESGLAEPLSRLSRDLLLGPALERARRALGDRAPRASRLAALIAPVEGRLMMNLSPFFERGKDDAIGRIEAAGAQWTPALAQDPTVRPGLALVGLRLAQLATEQAALSDEVTRFERDAEQERRWLAEMDLAILPDDALTTTLGEVREFLARAHRLDTAASAAVVAGHGLLASVLSAADATRATFLAHAVSAGADVVTARPAAALCHVASIARLDTEGARALASGARELPDGPLRRAVARFLEAYGDRGILESELSIPRWAEDPAPLHAVVAASLRGDPVDPDVVLSRVRALADRQLALLEPRLSFFETRLSRDILSRYRELLRLRERCRVRIAHGLSMMRFVARDVDRRIRRLDPALEPNSALLLTLDELSGAVRKYRADLAPLVRTRRMDLEAERAALPPPPCFRGIPEPAYPVRHDPILLGVPAASGVVDGRVTRIGPRFEGIEQFTPGDVIVAESLDLGLVPLFHQARGVVAELGTPLSSAAVVARDAGVPVVTGITLARGLLRDGDRVTVDGDQGTVERFGP